MYILTDHFNGDTDAGDFALQMEDVASDLAWVQDSDALSDMEVMRSQHSLTRKQMGI